MKAASVKEIKDELKTKPPHELLNLCLRMARFKKENKELMTYLLFEQQDEDAFVRSIKNEMDELFENINHRRFYYIKKSVRKILTNVKKYIRYSTSKETEVELLLHFCQKLKEMKPSFKRNKILVNHYRRQLDKAQKVLLGLHEDLQFDYFSTIEDLNNV